MKYKFQNIAILFVVATTVTCAHAADTDPKFTVEQSDIDVFENRVHVKSPIIQQGGVGIMAEYTCPGKEPQRPKEVTIRFVTVYNKTDPPKWQGIQAVRFIFSGTEYKIPTHVQRLDYVGRKAVVLEGSIPTTTFLQWVNAAKAEFEFEPKTEAGKGELYTTTLQRLRQFAESFIPTSNVEAGMTAEHADWINSLSIEQLGQLESLIRQRITTLEAQSQKQSPAK